MPSTISLGARRGARLAVAALLTAALALAGQPAASSARSGGDDIGTGYMGAGSEAARERTATTAQPLALPAGPRGIDVSHWQGTINWASVRNAGIQFAWIKATEAHSWRDPQFDRNYTRAYQRGVIRGAYHFARPDVSGGRVQANFFVNNGGAWSRDNRTLPGVLDIEANPSNPDRPCYRMSPSQLRSWILGFYNRYKERTGRDVVIYTSRSFWNRCTDNWGGMANRSPLWVAHWTSASRPTLPSGFTVWTTWQYTSTGSVAGISGNVDRNVFNGSRTRLLALANNTR
ncbi:GH25 family lysozyme [Georgenia alba]|uniref:GH25 family lysozyme n=1 Tax=Georgenia alba TaxID=2233858 RepID=A0ABW2Q9X3_9MICO